MTDRFSTDCPQAADLPEEAAEEAETRELNAAEAWAEACRRLGERLSPHTFRTYVKAARVLPAGDGDPFDLLRLGYSSRFLADWVGDAFRAEFERELLAVSNREISVHFVEAPPDPAAETAEPAAPAPAPAPAVRMAPAGVAPTQRGPAPQPAGPGEPPPGARTPSGLLTKYTFDQFVVGASNQFAYATCQAVADAPGRTYNPLFLYGGVGLGKTHLMQAAGLKALAAQADLRVVYTTSEQFTNDLISSLQNRKMPEFRRRYREQCDILLIDDIQFIAGRKATEEEFFHTFNALHSLGKQIILTSDTTPRELDGMEERLRSRFEWGLIADIQPPELETRVAILKSKAQSINIDLPDEVAQFLATHIRQNVRELEGSLTRVAAFTQLTRGSVTVDICKDVLRDVLVNGGKPVDCDQIIKACAERFKVTVADIKGPVRKRQIARARQAAMYLCRRLTKCSFPDIGDKFGKDHSTVMSACDRVAELMVEDNDYRAAVESLERELGVPS